MKSVHVKNNIILFKLAHTNRMTLNLDVICLVVYTIIIKEQYTSDKHNHT